ncbi:MAG: class I SAM-dependent methyltransferase [Bacteroidales bacterium]|nr:class I SAM-dependent methyltransferase [Bacteroidales bacterium]
MGLYLKGVFYSAVIDPMLISLRRGVVERVTSTDRVIDIACGPGTLALAVARRAQSVTAVDIEEDLIGYASQRTDRKGITNVNFRAVDASDLSCFADNEFDVALTSMAIHQFDPALAIKILAEMKRIAVRVIVADYNCPMAPGIYRSLAYGIERFAGGDHYRNFRNFMSVGGMEFFTREAGLSIDSATIRGMGVLKIGEMNRD